MSYCRNCGGELSENLPSVPDAPRCAARALISARTAAHRQAPAMMMCPQCKATFKNIDANTGIPSTKSKTAAGLLGIFLGAFGVHNFYLGYTAKAVVQLVITLLTCCMCAPVAGIWGLVEGILILCGNISLDGKGYPLCD